MNGRLGWERGLRWRHSGVILLALIATLAILTLRGSYRIDLLATIGIFFIIAMGLDLLVGYTGPLSLGHNGFVAIGGYGSAILTATHGLDPWLAILVGIAVSSLAALLLSPVLGLEHLYLAVATLAFGIGVYELTQAFFPITGGEGGIGGLRQLSVAGLTINSDLRFAILVWILLIPIFWFSRNIAHSRVGRALRAIHGDEIAAKVAGVNVVAYKTQIFVLSAAYASLGGSLYAHFRNYMHPSTIETALMVSLLLMLFLGGPRTIWGALLGVTLLRGLPEVVGVFEEYKVFAYGVVFILVLFFMPGGIAAGVNRLLARVGIAREVELAPVTRPSPPANTASRRPERWVDGADPPILEATGLGKGFGGLQAVADLSFAVQREQIFAVIGPNGAGKSTLFNLINGVYPPNAGHVTLDGKEITGLRPDQIARLGVGRVFQIPRLFPDMTVLEHVLVGRHPRTKAEIPQAALWLPSVAAEETKILEDAAGYLALVGLTRKASTPVMALPYGEKKLVQIARALAGEPRILLLDEPAGGLNDVEKEQLKGLLLDLRDSGLTIMLVEHDMRFVMGLSDWVLVMDYGRKIAEGLPEEIQRNEDVIRAYLGTDDLVKV